MVQRRQSEGSVRLLGGFTGTLALGLVLGFGFGGRHPLKIVRGVLPAVTERDSVINNVISAWSSGFSSSRTRIGKPELVLSAVGSEDSAMRISGASSTLSSSEARKTQDEYKN
jgi:hypothetical protein